MKRNVRKVGVMADRKMLTLPTVKELEAFYFRKGYAWFSEGDYNLNLIGLRSPDVTADTFNDWFLVIFKQHGITNYFGFPCTTDPGTFYRLKPLSVDGTAIVKPGQSRGVWKLGLHQGKYPALVQRRPIEVYRDNNKDQVLNFDAPSDTGFFGINCHRASLENEANQVGKWSAGCQVLANPVDFELLLMLCRQSANRYGNGFTYTLINHEELQWNR